MDIISRGGGVSAIVEYDYTAKEPDELDLVKGAIIHGIKQMPGGWWEGTLQTNGKTGMFPDNFVRVVDANDDNAVTLRDKSATVNRRCKVIYSYTQVNDDELSLAVGDVIEFLGEVEEGWWRGRLKNKIGVFPSNFVIAIEPSPILASKRPVTTLVTSTVAKSAAASTSAIAVAAAAAAVAAATAAAAAANTSTKKTNRLSFHTSKEDLLSSTIATTTAATSSSLSTIAPTTATAAPVDDVAPTLPPKPQRDYCRVEFPYAPQNDDELELKVGDIITIINMELPDKGWWKGELRGKVGVFPDNFVKLLAPSDVSPLNDSQHSHRTAKTANAVNTSSATTANLSTAAASANTIANAFATTSKVFIKKSGSTSSTQSSNRKDSFGSRDSLNDILSETGLSSGNVAAQRKSLENKNLDLSNAPDASSRLALKKQQLQESKTLLTSNSHTTTSTTAMSSNSSTSELRKSLENLDEKTKTPPPVLTKKPSVPTKKSTTVTSVAGNILSGLKQKVRNVENKLTTAASHDYADGVGSSKMSPGGGLPDAAPSGNVVMRRAATIAVEDSDFDRVERSSILPDMRAGRVKAPKRRPPSAAINVIGESNNNNSVYLNGSSSGGSAELLQQDDGKRQSSDDNSTGEEQLAKPKPREWEKKKAPWMEELKASQVKKKTSPNVEPRMNVGSSSVGDRTSKLLAEDVKISSSSSTTTTNACSSSSSTKVQSSAISSSIMQQSMLVESSQQLTKKEHSAGSSSIDAMTKSMSSKLATDSSCVEDVRARPNSLSIRNRSTSPSIGSAVKSSASPAAADAGTSNVHSNSNASSSATLVSSTAAKTSVVNNHYAHTSSSNTATATTTTTMHENNIPVAGKANSHSSAPSNSSSSAGGGGGAGGDGVRVFELERRIEKLEVVVHAQQRTIDELVRTLREETDRVKVLRGELDKYAQKQTRKGKFDNWMF